MESIMYLRGSDFVRPTRTKINIKTASKVAELYCEKNKLSIPKLKTQKVVEIGDSVIFAQPTNISSHRVAVSGLKSDKESQPKPTLVLKKTGRGYIVEETEHTNIYLR